MSVPRSEIFDDVYFSAEDGLAESVHVFLEGNGLPDAWAGHEVFTICELGFGTGLNLLAVAKLWLESDYKPRMRYVSFEKYPVDADYIGVHLARWGELSEVLGAFLGVYDIRHCEEAELTKQSSHQNWIAAPSATARDDANCFSLFDGFDVHLIFGDVNEELPRLDAQVDCWFLDGFKPSSNPDMWSETVFSNMARLSNAGARFATFTAAGFVRRGLEGQGFAVSKVPGFGRKREMLVGQYVDA